MNIDRCKERGLVSTTDNVPQTVGSLQACNRFAAAHKVQQKHPSSTISTMRNQSPQRRVVVVGAGLAGLMSAVELKRQGLKPILLEATDRVGGRVNTCYRNNKAIELGGEFIDSEKAHPTIHRVVESFGLKLAPSELPALRQVWLNECDTAENITKKHGPLVASQMRHVKASIKTLTELIDLENVLANPVAKKLDRYSLSDWLSLLDVHPIVKEILLRDIRLEYGNPKKTSLLYFSIINKLYQNISDDEIECFRIAGGNQKLPQAMAEKLQGDLELNAPVSKITMTRANEWQVSTPKGDFMADYLVLAIPARCVSHISFDPPLDPKIATACEHLFYADHFKLTLDYQPDQIQEQGKKLINNVQSTSAVQWTWLAPEEHGSGSGNTDPQTVICYGLSDSQEKTLNEVRKKQVVEKAQNNLYQLSQQGLKHASFGKAHFWGLMPYSLGSYSQYGPSQVDKYWAIFRSRHGQMVFAGEHTASRHVGYMEGALESGLRASRQIIDIDRQTQGL